MAISAWNCFGYFIDDTRPLVVDKMKVIDELPFKMALVESKPDKKMATSLCLLLEETEYQHLLSSPTIKSEVIKTPTAKLLENRSRSIMRAFNDRDVAAPYALHATRDFLFVHENSHGTSTALTKHQAMYVMQNVILKNIEHFAEVTSSAVEVDEEKGQAIVWLGMRIHDRPDGFMPGTEKVTMFYWRRVDGYGGERRWMWFKHTCLSARPPFPS